MVSEEREGGGGNRWFDFTPLQFQVNKLLITFCGNLEIFIGFIDFNFFQNYNYSSWGHKIENIYSSNVFCLVGQGFDSRLNQIFCCYMKH